jgi:FAD/FMN-containing dehydrogenase
VVRPQTSKEVSKILQYCNDRRIGVVPQAGNTGLVGGSVSKYPNEIILSVEGLSQIHGLDSHTGILKAQSGCILEELHNYAAQYDHLVPLDLGSKGTCQIGGNLSTNAGGSYYYRYGSLHATTIGLEVVLPNGTILNLGYDPAHLKDNTGYHLKHLFIGAEGTLGVITNVALLCPRLPSSKGVALLACETYEHVCHTLALAKSELGEILAAFEFMDDAILEIVMDHSAHTSDLALPFSALPNYAILVETHGSNEEHDQLKLQNFVETAFVEGLVHDGAIAHNIRQFQDFWKIREMCNPSVAAQGYVYKYDVSLPIIEFERFILDIRSRLEEGVVCTNWGHVIDGNLHLNVVIPGRKERDEKLYRKLEQIVIRGVIAAGGSISAEHGLGQYKNKHLTKIKDAAQLQTMYQVKHLFDPHGIMNPGKFFP